MFIGTCDDVKGCLPVPVSYTHLDVYKRQMRTFHTGGVAGGADMTQGLPRVEELFEARKPKQLAILSEIDLSLIHI